MNTPIQNNTGKQESNSFYKIIGQLNREKQIIEQKLMQLGNFLLNILNIFFLIFFQENKLMSSESSNQHLNAEREVLREELDNVMMELGKARMQNQIQDEE